MLKTKNCHMNFHSAKKKLRGIKFQFYQNKIKYHVMKEFRSKKVKPKSAHQHFPCFQKNTYLSSIEESNFVAHM